MANEDPKVQYTKMIEEFKKACVALLDQSKPAMDELEKATNLNFDNMSQAYVKGCNDMKAQVLKGNQSMIEKFQTSYKAVQQNLDESFNQLKSVDMTQFQSNVSKFTDTFDATLSKAPALKTALNIGAESSAKLIDQKKKEVLDAAQNKYNEATKLLKESAEDTAKKLTVKMEDLAPKSKTQQKK